MRDYLLKRPMLLSAIICCVIVISGYYSIYLLFCEAVLLTAAVVFMISRKASGVHIFAVLPAFLVIISVCFTLYNISRAENLAQKSCEAEFTVCETPFNSNGFSYTTIEITESDLLKKGDKLLLFAKPDALKVGGHYKAMLSLSKIEDSFRQQSFSEKVYLTANAHDIKHLTYNDDFILTAAESFRGYIRTTLFKYTDYNEAATLCALIFGERKFFSDTFYTNVKLSGVSHIMVVSGMHLTIFVMIVTFLIHKLIYNRRVIAIFMLLAVLFMTVLCGFTQSMLRAGVTYIIAAIALIINKANTPENTLGAAFSVICIASPFAVFSIAFQLSFLSTFGILAVATSIINYVREKETIKSKALLTVFSSLTITLSALLMTLPVAIYNFGYISMVSVIVNLLISTAVTVAILLSLLGIIAAAIIPPLAEFIFSVCNLITKYINGTINFFGELPFAAISLPRYTAFIAIILIILTFWALLACKTRRDMLKLEELNKKIITEGGRRLKWR